MTTLVTGAAGFIGFHICEKLIRNGHEVIGFDNLNSYYDIKLKEFRLSKLLKESKNKSGGFVFVKGNLEDEKKLKEIFETYNPNKVINLAAQAGVRYSIECPNDYIQSNLVGFSNLIELCRQIKVKHFVYASSSSVYGGNEKLPFSELHSVDHPVSLYAATKKANELIAHSYSHLYKLPTTGLRFFTVYGPWGRPDMALFKFTKAIFEGKEIEIYNDGNMIRDFTYIDDIVESIYRVLLKIPTPNRDFDKKNPNPATSFAPYRIFNIGNSQPVNLMDYIDAIEEKIGIEAKKKFLPMQPGDVKATFADTSLLEKEINFKPSISIKDGVKNFVNWYRYFYNVD